MARSAYIIGRGDLSSFKERVLKKYTSDNVFVFDTTNSNDINVFNSIQKIKDTDVFIVDDSTAFLEFNLNPSRFVEGTYSTQFVFWSGNVLSTYRSVQLEYAGIALLGNMSHLLTNGIYTSSEKYKNDIAVGFKDFLPVGTPIRHFDDAIPV